MAIERPSLRETNQIYRNIGLPAITAAAATLITKGMSLIPDLNRGNEPRLPSEIIWDAIPREQRFYTAEIRFKDPSLQFSPTHVAKILQSTHPEHVTHAQSINERPTDAPFIVLDETIDGLLPEDFIQRSQSSLIISNGPEGSLLVTADHKEFDSVQIIPLVQGLLPYARRESRRPPELIVPGRKIEINHPEAGINDPRQILLAAAAAGIQTRGPESLTCFPVLTKSPDYRVLPEFLRNSDLVELKGNPFRMFLEKQADTQLGKAITVLDLNKYPAALIAAIYKYIVMNIPKALIPPISSLVGMGPGRNFKPNTTLEMVNPAIGSEIKGIGVDFRIYPRHWEIPMLFSVSGQLPNGEGNIAINSLSISGGTSSCRSEFEAAFAEAAKNSLNSN